MPPKVSLTECCIALERMYSDRISIALSEHKDVLKITFEEFENAMRYDDFISSQTTIRGKWKALLASGILFQNPGIKTFDWAFIDFAKFLQARDPLMYRSFQMHDAHTQKRTIKYQIQDPTKIGTSEEMM